MAIFVMTLLDGGNLWMHFPSTPVIVHECQEFLVKILNFSMLILIWVPGHRAMTGTNLIVSDMLQGIGVPIVTVRLGILSSFYRGTQFCNCIIAIRKCQWYIGISKAMAVFQIIFAGDVGLWAQDLSRKKAYYLWHITGRKRCDCAS